MKVLLIGSGGREHALAWKLSASPRLTRLYASPGSDAIAALAQCQALPDPEAIAAFARREGIGLVVVGPEAPLVAMDCGAAPRGIEEVVLRHPAVTECSVVGRPHPEWGEEVVAFVVCSRSVPVPELDALCLANIARFKRPRQYRFVAALPKNNYGKVLKTELRRMAGDVAK